MQEEKGISKGEKIMLNVQEVAALVGCSTNSAYRIIRICNKELKDAGKITITGKVNRHYLAKKLDVSDL